MQNSWCDKANSGASARNARSIGDLRPVAASSPPGMAGLLRVRAWLARKMAQMRINGWCLVKRLFKRKVVRRGAQLWSVAQK